MASQRNPNRPISSRSLLASKLSPFDLHNRAPWNNIVCGILVFSSRRALYPLPESVAWNLFWTGMIIAAIGLTTMLSHGNVSRNYWSGVNVLAGLWLIASTRILPTGPAMSWAQICLGVLTITIAITSLANEGSPT